jgi:hypothetical protein
MLNDCLKINLTTRIEIKQKSFRRMRPIIESVGFQIIVAFFRQKIPQVVDYHVRVVVFFKFTYLNKVSKLRFGLLAPI